MDGSQPTKRSSKQASAPRARQYGRQGSQAAKTGGIRQRSAPPGTTGEALVKYVFVELDVPRENHAEFQQRMHDLAEVMFDHVRWELIFASYPITGVVNRFVHIWKIPDESTLVDVMREGAVKLDTLTAPKTGSLEAIFRASYRGVQDLVQRTRHTLMTSLPYDPTHVGFQTQTIVLDTDGEAFMIDHAKLRAEAQAKSPGLSDISDDLEQVRRAKFTRVRRDDSPLPKDESAAQHVKSLHPDRVEFLKEVQKHLNRGSAVARVTSEGEQALLFNLAGLKPKSVFQAVELGDPDPKKPLKLGQLAAREDGEVDMPVERLLIAMPWGGVYDITEARLKKLVGTIPKPRQAATKKAVEPLLDGYSPIASIPSERDEVIGDGCACYVINLSSFKCR